VALESADPSVVPPLSDRAAVVALEEPPEELFKERRIGVIAWIAIGWLVFITVVAALAPILPLKNPLIGVDYLNVKAGFFSHGHVLGTDDSGLDVMSRAVWGARSSLLIGLGSIILGTLIGGFLGLVAGFKGRLTDSILSGSFNFLLAFPQLVLALMLVSVFAPSATQGGAQPGWSKRVLVVIIAVGIVSIPILARIARANTVAWSQREFVMAARAEGASDFRVMFREVLPNIVPAMLSIALLGVAIVIVLEGALAIFGLSIAQPDPSWGNMIQSQLSDLNSASSTWIVPSMLIFVTVLALNYLGDVVRSRFDVRESAL